MGFDIATGTSTPAPDPVVALHDGSGITAVRGITPTAEWPSPSSPTPVTDYVQMLTDYTASGAADARPAQASAMDAETHLRKPGAAIGWPDRDRDDDAPIAAGPGCRQPRQRRDIAPGRLLRSSSRGGTGNVPVPGEGDGTGTGRPIGPRAPEFIPPAGWLPARAAGGLRSGPNGSRRVQEVVTLHPAALRLLSTRRAPRCYFLPGPVCQTTGRNSSATAGTGRSLAAVPKLLLLLSIGLTSFRGVHDRLVVSAVSVSRSSRPVAARCQQPTKTLRSPGVIVSGW